MTCAEVRGSLLERQRGRLAAAAERELAHHLAGCAACARASAEEEALDALLRRLPRSPAPPALKARLAALAPSAEPAGPEAAPPRARRRWARAVTPGVAAAALALAALALVERAPPRSPAPLATLAAEAVSDHLRVLQRPRPVDLESAGTHDVKPWFEGKLDFAPSVPGPVHPEMRLVGGALGYFLDRPAAVMVYGFRRHLVTLLAFRADGLAWPGAAAEPRAPAAVALRGFHVYLWRAGGLGYALVGDVDAEELSAIAAKLAAQT